MTFSIAGSCVMMNMKFRTFPLITISCVTGDQPRPGSFLKKREEPGNEVGHLTVASACSGRHLTTYFIKSKIPRGYPGGGGWSRLDLTRTLQQTRCLLLGKCSWLVLEYIRLCGFAQYGTKRLQYILRCFHGGGANAIHNDFATKAIVFIKITCTC
jgi:hypothetical protein